MQAGKILLVFPFILASCFWLVGCASPQTTVHNVQIPKLSYFYKKPTDSDLHAAKELVAQLQVGMTRQDMLAALKPIRLLSINYHGTDAQNTYWLRPGIKITLHFTNRDTLLVVPADLPHGEPDDTLLDLPDAISVAAGPDVPDPEKSWTKIPVASLN